MPRPIYKNRVGNAVSGTPGTGPITLGSAETAHQSFAAAYAANANVDILIEDGNAWEVARDCTYTHTGTTLSRGTLEASSTGSALSLSSAAKVFVVDSAARLQAQISRPALVVTGQGAATQSLSAATWTKISTALNSVATIDTIGGWDGANKRYTPNVAGNYLCIGQLRVFGTASASFILCGLAKNGTREMEGARITPVGTTDQESAPAIVIVELNGSTDYIELQGYIAVAPRSVYANQSTALIITYLGE